MRTIAIESNVQYIVAYLDYECDYSRGVCGVELIYPNKTIPVIT